MRIINSYHLYKQSEHYRNSSKRKKLELRQKANREKKEKRHQRELAIKHNQLDRQMKYSMLRD